ncbi:hypothetical protein F3Y22_tig00111877pilonHSYRG00276 [Hibiscus syriacus]|uniref:Dof zinc finger protein n=1 Tax=Hibiscus syriacus TaxID=106335 RepID=A0A6A2YBB6_HIBSY|nr:hypothetical protein F3Y22_tig00111877pilonHSYRG00276 [Hibiscus syriacus]
MAFSSVPVYLDPPDWQQFLQPQTHQQAGVINNESHGNSQLPPPSQSADVGRGAGGKRPNSMVERARLAKIPQPESALKCPRCESTNTKFCYFNNYNLSQPRHFCKTCRRYWTRGGALRNIPVAGSCRRNKRSKGSNRSKSPSVVSARRTDSISSSGALASNSCTDILGHMNLTVPQLPLLPPLHHLGDYDSDDVRLNFGGIQPHVAVTAGGTDMDFQGSTNGLVEQWRSLQQVQQFPFLTSLEQRQNELYPFEREGFRPPLSYDGHHLLRSRPSERTITQLTAVKLEDFQGLNLSRNFLGISGNDHQYWGGNAGNSCTDLSGFIKEKSS